MTYLPIVGGRFRPPADTILSNLPFSTPLTLIREPSNPHDANAIGVWLPEGWGGAMDLAPILEAIENNAQEPPEFLGSSPLHLGYLPREVAERLADALDSQGGTALGSLAFDVRGRGCFVPEEEEEDE